MSCWDTAWHRLSKLLIKSVEHFKVEPSAPSLTGYHLMQWMVLINDKSVPEWIKYYFSFPNCTIQYTGNTLWKLASYFLHLLQQLDLWTLKSGSPISPTYHKKLSIDSRASPLSLQTKRREGRGKWSCDKSENWPLSKTTEDKKEEAATTCK